MKRETKQALEILEAMVNHRFIWFANYDAEYRVVAMQRVAVIKNTTLLKLLNFQFAATIGNGVFVVDDLFYSLSQETQAFTLSHEFGHNHCGHTPKQTNSFRRLIAILKGEVLEEEKEADDFATTLCGGPQSGYAALMELAEKVKTKRQRTELIKRANRYKPLL